MTAFLFILGGFGVVGVLALVALAIGSLFPFVPHDERNDA